MHVDCGFDVRRPLLTIETTRGDRDPAARRASFWASDVLENPGGGTTIHQAKSRSPIESLNQPRDRSRGHHAVEPSVVVLASAEDKEQIEAWPQSFEEAFQPRNVSTPQQVSPEFFPTEQRILKADGRVPSCQEGRPFIPVHNRGREWCVLLNPHLGPHLIRRDTIAKILTEDSDQQGCSECKRDGAQQQEASSPRPRTRAALLERSSAEER